MFLTLDEMLSVFYHWKCLVWVYHLWPLLCWYKWPLWPFFLEEVFIINGHWILSKAFSASIEIIIWFLSFSLLIWCITFIDLCILNPCIPWINPAWSWCMIFLCVDGFCLLEFHRRFLHLCSSVILACNFLCLSYLYLFWYQSDGGLVE